MHRDRNAGWRHRSGAQHGGAGREANLILSCRRTSIMGHPVGGTFWFQIFIQAPSPEIWSETISSGEEVLAQKWGGLFWATSLEKIFGGAIAIISPPKPPAGAVAPFAPPPALAPIEQARTACYPADPGSPPPPSGYGLFPRRCRAP